MKTEKERLERIDRQLTSRHLDERMRHYLDIPKWDDEMRDIAAGLDVIVTHNKGVTWDVLISSYDAEDNETSIYPYFADILEAVGHLSTELPAKGLEFFEVHAVSPYNVRIRIIINSVSQYDSWCISYFGPR